jgi:hypothetical protein
MGRLDRGRGCPLIVSAVTLALLLAAPVATADGGTELVVSTSPSGPPTRSLPLPIRSHDTTGSMTFFLREVAGRAVPGLVMYAAPPAGLSVIFARPGGQAPAAALALDLAEDASLDITAAGTWDDYGTVDVPLLVRMGDVVTTIAVLHVERPGGPPLTVVGAAPGTGLALASTGPTLATAITVATGDRRAVGIVAKVSAFRDASSGTRYAVDQPEVRIEDMEANVTATVSLDADLPYSGTFTANLRLSHDGIADPPVALTVTRTLGASGVAIDFVQTSSSEFFSFDVVDAFNGKERITRAVVLHEAAGKAATVDAPMFVRATGKVGEVATGDAAVKVVGTKVSPSQPGCNRKDSGRITIERGKQCRLEVTLEVPGHAGQYDGTLRFTQPGYTPLEAALTLQLRRGLLTAFLVIFLGLFIGYLLKQVLAKRRARLELLSKVARIGRELDQRVAAMPDGVRDDTERRTYAQMRVRLTSIAADPGADAGGATDIDDQLDAMRALVPVLVPWVLLRRAALAAPPPAKAGVIDDIEKIGATLAAPGTTKTEAGALPAKLEELEKKLRGLLTAMVRNEVERVKGQVADLFPATERAALDAQFDRALEFVAGEEGSPEEAQRELAIAQGMAAQAMSARLHELLDAATPPAAMDPGAWAQLQVRVRTTLAGIGAKTPDAALEAVREADYMLLAGLVGAVSDKVTATRDTYAGSESPAYQARVTALNAILGHLTECRSALTRGHLATAHTAYNDARAGLAEAHANGFLAGTAAEAAAAPPDLMSPPDAALAAATAVPATAVVPVVDPADVQKQWGWYQRFLVALTLVVGVAVGLLALYVGKPTWGSLSDVLLALLWGAGLFQASGAIAQGFSGVRTTLTS